MAILKIIKDGDPTLRKISKDVDTITPRILTLLDDMKDTLVKANGVGLAAVQVGVLRRVVLVVLDSGETVELINPKIVAREGEQREVEGCLSVPGKYGITCRPEKVTVEALDRNGNLKTYTGEGLTARAFCHELDHLDGVLYKDHALEMFDDKD